MHKRSPKQRNGDEMAMNGESEPDKQTGKEVQESVNTDASSQTELLYDLLAEMRLP